MTTPQPVCQLFLRGCIYMKTNDIHAMIKCKCIIRNIKHSSYHFSLYIFSLNFFIFMFQTFLLASFGFCFDVFDYLFTLKDGAKIWNKGYQVWFAWLQILGFIWRAKICIGRLVFFRFRRRYFVNVCNYWLILIKNCV